MSGDELGWGSGPQVSANGWNKMKEFSDRQQKIIDEYEKLPETGIVSKYMCLESMRALTDDAELQEIANYLYDRDVKSKITAAVDGFLNKK